jgi:hypothetical protein
VGAYPGIGGRMKSERVGASNRNPWADHPGIRKQISYSAVETIWNRRNKLPRPVHLMDLLSEQINKL